MRVALYARYSSDLQSEASIDGQISACQSYLFSNMADASVIAVYTDEAISGSQFDRPGLQALMYDARIGKFDVLVCEGLDRLSRTMEDMATIYKVLEHAGVKIRTIQEGEVSTLHVGFKGTQNAMFLEDLKKKTQRGMNEVARSGRIPGGIAYGYKVSLDDDGRVIPGVRQLHPVSSHIVLRIFRDFAAGKSAAEITKELNREKISSPRGGLWRRERILGTHSRQDGILSNPVYKGEIVWGRRKEVKDPVTGKRKAVMRDEKDIIRTYVPELRIISDDLWNQAQARRRARTVTARKAKQANKEREKRKAIEEKKGVAVLSNAQGRPLTGIIFCGACGGRKLASGRTRYVCQANRVAGTCSNSRGWREVQIWEFLFSELNMKVGDGAQVVNIIEGQIDAINQRRKDLEGKRLDLNGRLTNLLEAIENGLDLEESVPRSIQLKDEKEELEKLFREVPDVSSKIDAQEKLGQTIKEMQRCAAMEDRKVWLHRMLSSVIKGIEFTPIPKQRSGETPRIVFNDAGWSEFWRLSFEK